MKNVLLLLIFTLSFSILIGCKDGHRDDAGTSVTVGKNGEIYLTGWTQGSLNSNTNKGDTDIFIIKANSEGEAIWTKQWGSPNCDYSRSIATDSKGFIYVTGYTMGDFAGNRHNSRQNNVFITKFDSSGGELWVKQWGWEQSGGFSLAVDENDSVIIAGAKEREKAFLIKLDEDGKELWVRQWDGVNGVGAVAEKNKYIYLLSGSDLTTLTKLSNEGEELWTISLGESKQDIGTSVQVDNDGYVYVTWWTPVDGLSRKNGIEFITKVNNNGEVLWTKQQPLVHINAMSIGNDGHIYLTGFTHEILEGNTGAGGIDIFLKKLNSDGEEKWSKQWGTSLRDEGESLIVSDSGEVYVTGWTYGNFYGKTDLKDPAKNIFLSKWESDGTLSWTKQWGSKGD